MIDLRRRLESAMRYTGGRTGNQNKIGLRGDPEIDD
jgi:hypothetical protein